MSFPFFLFFISQSVSGTALDAPTSFTEEIDLTTRGADSETSEIFGEATSTSIHDSGVKIPSIRGSSGNDVAITLEGIPLSTEASGDFDLNNLSLFGLESARVVRGGYAPYSGSPMGEVQLKLPREKIYRGSFGVGSYQAYFIGMQAPNASFSLEQSENDFSFQYNNAEQKRTHNAYQRINSRGWKNFNFGNTQFQIWSQLQYSDQELPGSLYLPTPNGSMQNFIPTLAAQMKKNNLSVAVWGTFKNQTDDEPDFSSKTVNRWLSGGQKISHRQSLGSQTSSEEILITTFDKLWRTERSPFQNNGEIPFRSTVSGIWSLFISPTDRDLFHPRIRIDYVSDLPSEKFSIHPGFGESHRLTEHLRLLWNLSYLSRSPTFWEMYVESPPYVLGNRHLKRQHSLQTDVGYEFSLGRFKLRQAVFTSRNDNFLRTTENSGVFQVQNVGSADIVGLENEVRWQPEKKLLLDMNYTLQRVELDGHQDNYQPTHLAHAKLTLFPDENFNADLPIYYRSSVKISRTTPGEISDQWDLGFHAKAKLKKWQIDLRIFNLLGWNRMEVNGYPLGSEVHGKISATYLF